MDIKACVRRETKVQSQVESYQKLTLYFIPPCLIFCIIRYVSRVCAAIQKKEQNPPKQLSLVAMEKEPSGRSWLRMANLRTYIYIYMYIYMRIINTTEVESA